MEGGRTFTFASQAHDPCMSARQAFETEQEWTRCRAGKCCIWYFELIRSVLIAFATVGTFMPYSNEFHFHAHSISTVVGTLLQNVMTL